MTQSNNAANRERDLIAEWMSRPWPSALDRAGDYYAEVIIPTLLAEVERLRAVVAEVRAIATGPDSDQDGACYAVASKVLAALGAMP